MNLSSDKKTLWVRLPENLQLPIAGGCNCGKCNNNPKWDTLAICTQTGKAHTVHYPDMKMHSFEELAFP